MNNIALTAFARRQFTAGFVGTKITWPEDDFVEQVNNKYNNYPSKLVAGYADFCQLLFTDNFINAPTATAEITTANYQYLRSGYVARNEAELPVLTRWFELPLPAPTAETLVIVLYSKQQIEREEQQRSTPDFVFDAKWGIVSVMAQMSRHEEPMTPITMMRNALGAAAGGSGVAIDADKYSQAVQFWQQHAIIKG